MKKTIFLVVLITFSNCYFGMNEDSGKITRDFYLISWDQKFWQISRSKNTSEFQSENIVIQHDVFGVGHDKNFIIAIQHPCKDKNPHLTDYNSNNTVNKRVTNYYIIELLKNEHYRINKYESKSKYLQARIELGVPEDLTYMFYDETFE